MTQEIIIDNIKYQLNTENKTAKVIDYQNEPVEVKILDFIDYENEKYKVTEIGHSAFGYCDSLTSVTIPDSVSIGLYGFHKIGIKLPKRYTEDGKLIAYKAFNGDMTCRDFQYEEGKSYEIEGEIKCCNRGFHACINLLDVFNYYNGEIGKDVVIHEVYLSGDIDDTKTFDSKICASKIEIGRRLSIKDINEIINSK
jgi:hypothetical protein